MLHASTRLVVRLVQQKLDPVGFAILGTSSIAAICIVHCCHSLNSLSCAQENVGILSKEDQLINHSHFLSQIMHGT